MTWSGNDDGTLTLLSAKLFEPQPFQINGETCQDGVITWAMLSVRSTPLVTIRPKILAEMLFIEPTNELADSWR